MKKEVPKNPAASTEREINITFPVAEAKEAYLAGTFNHWNPQDHPLKKNHDGGWEVKLHLPPGRYEYKLIVDGAWREDLSCGEKVPNDFGTYNCVLNVE